MSKNTLKNIFFSIQNEQQTSFAILREFECKKCFWSVAYRTDKAHNSSLTENDRSNTDDYRTNLLIGFLVEFQSQGPIN
jgi:hypothetical protein